MNTKLRENLRVEPALERLPSLVRRQQIGLRSRWRNLGYMFIVVQ